GKLSIDIAPELAVTADRHRPPEFIEAAHTRERVLPLERRSRQLAQHIVEDGPHSRMRRLTDQALAIECCLALRAEAGHAAHVICGASDAHRSDASCCTMLDA